jgi:hypothetical protein
MTNSEEEDWTTVKTLHTKDYQGKQQQKQKYNKRDRSQSLSPNSNKKQNKSTNIMTDNQLPSGSGTVSLNFQSAIPISNIFQPLSTEMDTSAPQTEEKIEKPPPMIVEAVNSYSNLINMILMHVIYNKNNKQQK